MTNDAPVTNDKKLIEFLDLVSEVADFLEQRGLNRGDNRFPASFRFAPEIREQGAKLRLGVIEMEKVVLKGEVS